jgi:RNA polymerase sigma factor (TIGR02999 family)
VANPPRAHDVTDLLLAWRRGDAGALQHLIPLVYDELKRLAHRQMRGEPANLVLQTTGLVHEAYLRLVDASRVPWQNRAHFFGVAARLMRQVLVDEARSRLAVKRGGATPSLPLQDVLDASPQRPAELVALDDALAALEKVDGRQAKVVELRYFGGLTVKETAEVLRVSTDTVTRDWNRARVWLLMELQGHDARRE